MDFCGGAHNPGRRAAREVIRALVRNPRLDEAEVDYLQVLAGLVSRYEATKFPREVASDRAILEFLVKAKGRPLSAVARDNAISERILAEVLVGNRTLTQAQIAKLGARFQVGEAAFPPRERAPR